MHLVDKAIFEGREDNLQKISLVIDTVDTELRKVEPVQFRVVGETIISSITMYSGIGYKKPKRSPNMGLQDISSGKLISNDVGFLL